VTTKFRLPIGQLTKLTNRQSEFRSLSHKSRVFKSHCNRTLKKLYQGKKTLKNISISSTLTNLVPRISFKQVIYDEDIFTHFRVAKIYWDENRFKLEAYIKIHTYLCILI